MQEDKKTTLKHERIFKLTKINTDKYLNETKINRTKLNTKRQIQKQLNTKRRLEQTRKKYLI